MPTSTTTNARTMAILPSQMRKCCHWRANATTSNTNPNYLHQPSRQWWWQRARGADCDDDPNHGQMPTMSHGIDGSDDGDDLGSWCRDRRRWRWWCNSDATDSDDEPQDRQRQWLGLPQGQMGMMMAMMSDKTGEDDNLANQLVHGQTATTTTWAPSWHRDGRWWRWLGQPAGAWTDGNNDNVPGQLVLPQGQTMMMMTTCPTSWHTDRRRRRRQCSSRHVRPSTSTIT